MLLWQRASEAGGEGGASAVEAGQSCSRHQGRHFLWGDKERDRREGKREQEISLMQHIKKKNNFRVYFPCHVSFRQNSDLQHFESHATAELCSCGNEEYVKISEMQGCQLKQIKLSPALRSKHT